MKYKILLLDGDTVQAISVARSLKAIGCQVSAFIKNKISYGYLSRYIDYKIIVPNTPEILEQFLIKYLENNPQDIILPLYNDSAEFLAKQKKRLEEQFSLQCAIPETDQFAIAYDKQLFMNFCKVHNYPHPRTSPLTQQNWKQAVDYVQLPALIKPNISAGARGIIKVSSKQELVSNIAPEIKLYGECTLQEFISNNKIYYNVMTYRDHWGNCSAHCGLKIMRFFPLKGGTSCFAQCVQLPDLEKICDDILADLNWHGFADFDVLKTENGDWKIIEINPRIPASIHGAYISGINFPQLIISDLLKLPCPNFKPTWNKFLRFYGLDAMWFLFSQQRFKNLSSWLNIFSSKVYGQDGSWRDPLPILGGVLSGLIKYSNPKFRKSKFDK